MVSMVGTTSACAENTPRLLRRRYHHGNYLRVRGEYGLDGDVPTVFLELPPRARRIQFTNRDWAIIPGTTSACAENTRLLLMSIARWWNYLRVRGEYRSRANLQISPLELPPRARRIRSATLRRCRWSGTTSACAENTATLANAGLTTRNYLRVRGEYARWLLAIP